MEIGGILQVDPDVLADIIPADPLEFVAKTVGFNGRTGWFRRQGNIKTINLLADGPGCKRGRQGELEGKAGNRSFVNRKLH